nr:hypothetical protein [Cyanobacterium sp. IPPAS B-1200]
MLGIKRKYLYAKSKRAWEGKYRRYNQTTPTTLRSPLFLNKDSWKNIFFCLRRKTTININLR